MKLITTIIIPPSHADVTLRWPNNEPKKEEAIPPLLSLSLLHSLGSRRFVTCCCCVTACHTHTQRTTHTQQGSRAHILGGKTPPSPIHRVIMLWCCSCSCSLLTLFQCASEVEGRRRWWRIRSGRKGMERTEKVGRDIQEKITINLSRAPTRHHFFGTSWRGKIRFSTTRTRCGRVQVVVCGRETG